ncbi:hypothetical protein O3P69_017947 [Scylla paramamosain]|uniref:Reverse transcriptase/retrotransposon-derived protein RNase H-like domain-containing protein n=1 Tax=Scylla paramamosain TaxID=85552 RepID=A0AAW0THV4_SCYPA
MMQLDRYPISHIMDFHAKPHRQTPSFNTPTIHTTDASPEAVSVVLRQEIKGMITTIAFFSKSLEACQRRHSAFDRKVLAIKEAVLHFCHF